MTDLNQNFSIYVGDNLDVDYDIGPDTTGLNLSTTGITWSAYPQIRGAFDKSGGPVMQKTKANGITVDDPLLLTFHISFLPADTANLAGNYGYELKLIDAASKHTTPTIGTMTVIDTGNPLNVVALKTMFQELANYDDATLQTALDEASLYVDDTWNVQDVAAATFYLAGHFVTAAQASSGSGGRLVSSERIGQISVNYAASTPSSDLHPSLSSSNYGLMFLALMRRNSPAILVV